MSTFANVLISSLDSRWKEIDLIISKAESEIANVDLHNALCRSAVVLISAHLEGFTKEISKSIISDINFFSSFREAPTTIKRTFCSMYLDTDNNNLSKKTNLLIDAFDKLDTKLLVDPFFFENNKNPSPSILDKVCKNFGVNSFFEMLESTTFDKVFEDEKSFNQSLMEQIKSHILQGTENYPYDLTPEEFGIDIKKSKRNDKRTLWETFLDELLKTRHGIAHGTNLENSLSIEEIRNISLKVQILQCAFSLIVFHCINK